MKFNKKPLLSILIPIYKYPEGLKRILYGFNFENRGQYEVLIADNSNDDSAEKVIEEWRNKSIFNITYFKNNPSISPGQNWNKLLDKSNGRFSLLMHHDEFPFKSDFLTQLCKAIEESPKIDVFILDCILVDFKSGRVKRHIPSFIKSFLLMLPSSYLYRRNYIGPTATFVCRTKCYPRFDEKLIWLIDVHLYVCTLFKNKKYMYLPNIKIGSTLGRTDSITAKIRKPIKEIRDLDISYLINVYKIKNIWFDNNLFSKIVRPIEFLLWGIMRAIEYMFFLALNNSAVKKFCAFHAIKPINNK